MYRRRHAAKMQEFGGVEALAEARTQPRSLSQFQRGRRAAQNAPRAHLIGKGT
jgi:hypothetical protein